jgi:hypothetical protein
MPLAGLNDPFHKMHMKHDYNHDVSVFFLLFFLRYYQTKLTHLNVVYIDFYDKNLFFSDYYMFLKFHFL